MTLGPHSNIRCVEEFRTTSLTVFSLTYSYWVFKIPIGDRDTWLNSRWFFCVWLVGVDYQLWKRGCLTMCALMRTARYLFKTYETVHATTLIIMYIVSKYIVLSMQNEGLWRLAVLVSMSYMPVLSNNRRHITIYLPKSLVMSQNPVLKAILSQ